MKIDEFEDWLEDNPLPELDKIDTTPTDFTKISKECDVKSLKMVGKYLKKKKEMKSE